VLLVHRLRYDEHEITSTSVWWINSISYLVGVPAKSLHWNAYVFEGLGHSDVTRTRSKAPMVHVVFLLLDLEMRDGIIESTAVVLFTRISFHG